MRGPSTRACRSARVVTSLLLLLIAVSIPISAVAQGTTGRITGTIRDAGAAILPDARVSAIDVDTGREWTTLTDANGTYTFPSLPLGTYRITASHPGFKTFVANLVSMSPSQVVRIDAVLELGSLDDRIEVTANRVNI